MKCNQLNLTDSAG